MAVLLQTAITGATPEWWCVDPTTYGLDNMTLDNTTFHTCPSSVQPLGGPLNVTDAQAAAVTGGGGGGCVRYYDPAMTTIVSEVGGVCGGGGGSGGVVVVMVGVCGTTTLP